MGKSPSIPLWKKGEAIGLPGLIEKLPVLGLLVARLLTGSNGMENEYPSCKLACPIMTDVREYVELIARRRFREAYAAVRRQNPLPAVCGRICTHPCETVCKRGQVDEPIAIAGLKRFAADYPSEKPRKTVSPGKATGHKVAVVGSGPAGLAAAHDLALLGHEVTVFEKLSVPGGMMAVGIPSYRLPKDVLAEQIDEIKDLGVEVRTGVAFGRDVTLKSLKDSGYGAVFLAIGLHLSRGLNVEGEDLTGVLKGVDFLRDVALGESVVLGEKVLVIGGGNVAIDVARTALRVGAKDVWMVCLEKQKEMPAWASEIERAREEGITIVNCLGPKRFLKKDGRLSGVEFKRCTCVFNEKGAFCPSFDETDVTIVEADTVIVAIGQAADLGFAKQDGIAVTRRGGLEADPVTMETSLPGVFSGGDVVSGPATVINAIAAGKRAAASIDIYMGGKSVPWAASLISAEVPRLSRDVIEKTRKYERSRVADLPVGDRIRGFSEVERVFSEELATREALRCLHCYLGARVNKGKCVSCLTCVRVCPLGIPSANEKGEITIDQVLCQACGMCALECPVQAIDINFRPRGGVYQDTMQDIGKSQGQDPVIVGFFDLQGNFGASDIERLRKEHANISPVMVFGLRRIDTVDVLRAFELGADGVFVAECPPDTDPFPATRGRLEHRIASAKTLVEELGLGKGRIEICTMPDKGLLEDALIAGFIKRIKNLGPSPLRVRQ
jgi:formate dehydrogenase beta subunit